METLNLWIAYCDSKDEFLLFSKFPGTSVKPRRFEVSTEEERTNIIESVLRILEGYVKKIDIARMSYDEFREKYPKGESEFFFIIINTDLIEHTSNQYIVLSDYEVCRSDKFDALPSYMCKAIYDAYHYRYRDLFNIK